MRSIRRISVAHRAESQIVAGGGLDALGGRNVLAGRGSTTRTHIAAWALSLVLHAVVLAAVVYVFHPLRQPEVANPERLIYVEPAPPPPPLPVAGADGAAADDPQVMHEQAAQLVRLSQSPTAIRTARRSPKPTARPARRQPVEPQPTRADVVRRGETGGQTEGVAGGIVGGKVGGTVGGHGDAPITAELAANPPLVLSRVLPEYPAEARVQRVEGQVLLRAVVDRSGHVEEEIVVARSVPLLDDAAVAALRQWHFAPGRDTAGRAVRVQIEVPMRFQLR